ncbi:MAG: HicB family protein, partial [Nitrosopumilales archaeon CG11_big_fil_rev_8_21_14_0_20_33_24]
MELTAIIKKGEKQYVALSPEIDVASQGYTIEEALKNLKEAVDLY